ALSSHLTAQVHRDGKIYELNFEKGIAIDNIHVIGETDRTGTRINFKADPEIFTETIEYDYDVLKSRIRELAFLDRKSTRLNSSHVSISYAVFCLKKKNIK